MRTRIVTSSRRRCAKRDIRMLLDTRAADATNRPFASVKICYDNIPSHRLIREHEMKPERLAIFGDRPARLLVCLFVAAGSMMLTGCGGAPAPDAGAPIKLKVAYIGLTC